MRDKNWERGQVGLITYMRTDSLNLSEKFLTECKQYLEGSLGSEFSLPARANSRLRQSSPKKRTKRSGRPM